MYVFIYSTIYFWRLEPVLWVTYLLYFGYMFMLSLCIFLVTGTVGFLSCLWFTRKIYGSIKARDPRSQIPRDFRRAASAPHASHWPVSPTAAVSPTLPRWPVTPPPPPPSPGRLRRAYEDMGGPSSTGRGKVASSHEATHRPTAAQQRRRPQSRPKHWSGAGGLARAVGRCAMGGSRRGLRTRTARNSSTGEARTPAATHTPSISCESAHGNSDRLGSGIWDCGEKVGSNVIRPASQPLHRHRRLGALWGEGGRGR